MLVQFRRLQEGISVETTRSIFQLTDHLLESEQDLSVKAELLKTTEAAFPFS